MGTAALLQPILDRLLNEACADGCAVLRAGGAVMAAAGRLPSFRLSPNDGRLQVVPLNEHASLLVSYTEPASLGLVRLRIRRATDELQRALVGIEPPATPPD
jgi:hypothetical protein